MTATTSAELYTEPRRVSAQKANLTKAQKWERITNDPEAEQVMRQILELDDECWHADSHAGRRCGCESSCPLWVESRGTLARMIEARQLLISALRRTFCQRFNVTEGYYRRFRMKVWYCVNTERQSSEDADTFTPEHRAALAGWLATA